MVRVTSDLRDEVQRQATTEVALDEVRRLRMQGESMVRSIDQVELTIGMAHRQGYACESQGEVLEAWAVRPCKRGGRALRQPGRC